MTVKIFSAILKGCCLVPVTITVSCEEGYGISISGLITETIHRDLSRVQFALLNCGFGFKTKKLHIEIEPAIFDGGDILILAIATGILIATDKIAPVRFIDDHLIVGGLGVTGNVQEIDNASAITAMALENGFKKIVLPAMNIKDPKFTYSNKIVPVVNLNELVKYLCLGGRHKSLKLPASLLGQLNFN
jgi:magnesium chelatase family protein